MVGAYNQYGVEKCLRKIGPKILYGHFWHQAYRLKDYANRYHRPLFVACGEGDDAMEQLVMSLSRTQKKELIEAVTGVICVSSENKRKCIEYGLADEKNIVVFPNAVDTDLFHVKPLNLELRHLLHVNDNDILLMFVGHFISRKGSGILARAIQMIGDPHIKVIFAGAKYRTEDDPNCDGIVFKGVIPHGDLPDYYACADVFVLPTQGEGCSNAIVEALSMGLPVISSVGPFNDDILNEKNSIRIDPTNVDELIAAILKMKNDHDFYHELKNNVVSKSKSFSISERADRVLSFVRSQSETYNRS
jgi:glycosyltransferase involved in cell wall biosynthesis